jgi:formate hydrogenlyase subunit 6/NADH:ubiquinone oxidoreductase subunit I
MSLDFLPQINIHKCIGCELCVRACPNGALAMIDDVAVVVNPEFCNYSGICQEICPTEAISLVYEIVFSRKEEDMTNAT